MYKTKIEQWGFKKNYNAAEKERFARIVKAHRDSGRSIPPLTLRNRAVKMDRVRRFCKQQRILEEICDALPAQSASKRTNLSQKAPPDSRLAITGVLASAIQGVGNSWPPMLSSGKMSFDPERPFSTTSKDGRIELILFQTKIYHQSLFDDAIDLNKLAGAAIPMQSNANLQIWQGKLMIGVGLLREQKPAKGWQMIHEACEMTPQILDQPPQSFFRFLLNTFNDSDLVLFPDFRAHIQRFFMKVSATTLGCNHPISVVLYHLQEPQILEDVTKIAFEVLMDVVGENAEPANPEVWSLRDFYCVTLQWRREWAAAESYGQRFLKQCEEVFGRVHWRTLCFLLSIGRAHYHQGLYELAEREFQDLLQRERTDLGDQFPNWSGLCALQQLAWIWEGRGDFTQSEEYWRQALAGAIKVWGVEDDLTIFLFMDLEQSLKHQGKDPEAWLQQNFGLSCI
jgi:tetratricopeptide (TPR) repeat protein